MLDHFKTSIKDSLRVAIRVTQHGLAQSKQNFWGVLEFYNPKSCTFYTPVGELGMSLEEKYCVTGLSPGELPYEEYIPCEDELRPLRESELDLYNTCWKMLCDFLICQNIKTTRHGGLSFQTWNGYLFPGGETNADDIRLLEAMLDNVVIIDRILDSRDDTSFIFFPKMRRIFP